MIYDAYFYARLFLAVTTEVLLHQGNNQSFLCYLSQYIPRLGTSEGNYSSRVEPGHNLYSEMYMEMENVD